MHKVITFTLRDSYRSYLYYRNDSWSCKNMIYDFRILKLNKAAYTYMSLLKIVTFLWCLKKQCLKPAKDYISEYENSYNVFSKSILF